MTHRYYSSTNTCPFQVKIECETGKMCVPSRYVFARADLIRGTASLQVSTKMDAPSYTCARGEKIQRPALVN